MNTSTIRIGPVLITIISLTSGAHSADLPPAALARAFGAVVLEGEGDASVSVEQLLAKAKAALE